MTTLNEPKRAGDFIRSPVGDISFENVTFRVGELLVPGQVVGVVDAGGQLGQWGALEEAATNNLEVPKGICFDHIDTRTGGTKKGTIVRRLAEVVGNRLTWPSSYSAGDITAGIAMLANENIIVRI